MISTLKKKLNKKGFTLAELLVVVAIIAILDAIAVPVFNSQLENARKSTDEANIRSAYAIAQTATLLQDTSSPVLTLSTPSDGTKYYFQKNGSFGAKTASPYQIKTTDTAGVTVDTVTGTFKKNQYIVVTWSDSTASWTVSAET